MGQTKSQRENKRERKKKLFNREPVFQKSNGYNKGSGFTREVAAYIQLGRGVFLEYRRRTYAACLVLLALGNEHWWRLNTVLSYRQLLGRGLLTLCNKKNTIAFESLSKSGGLTFLLFIFLLLPCLSL
ncbi:hypothetical protein LZ31DRAFT_170265 [Colletotrichum somersetense]|nr:hypothetical protein LZ31DRAFT_170265 [Colletotrichum somersetense]